MTNHDNIYNSISLNQMLLMVFDTKDTMRFIRTEINKEEIPCLLR
jgi:hypothetical protein